MSAASFRTKIGREFVSNTYSNERKLGGVKKLHKDTLFIDKNILNSAQYNEAYSKNLECSDSYVSDAPLAKRLFGSYARLVVALFTLFVAIILTNLIAQISQRVFYQSVWPEAIDVRDWKHLGTVTPVAATVASFLVGAPLIWYGMRLVRAERRALRRADAANRAKSSFLAATSHEIRTPLNGILGMAQVLARSELTQEQRHSLDVMVNSAKMLSNQLNDILDLSKVEAGRMTFSPKETDFLAMMREILTLWSGQADLKGLSVTLSIDPDVPRFQFFDPHRVQQCIGNLVSNAVKFTRDGGIEIIVSRGELVQGQRMIDVSVRDTGPGISPADIDRIFQPFEQTANSQWGIPGTGLGLSIAHHLALQMGGRIKAESRLGFGTTMTFSLPETIVRKTEPASELERTNSVPSKPNSLRILAVDDTETNLMVVESLLRTEGHNVVTANGGRSALLALERSAFDLVLMDVHMPDIDGLEALSEIRRSGRPWRNIPVIALTADAMSGDRERYMDLGMNGYVTKPINIDKLLDEIQMVVAVSQSEDFAA